MTPDKIRDILERATRGDLTVDAAIAELKAAPFRDLGFARVDTHRALRNGIPEVVFAEGKTAAQIVGIARSLIDDGQGVLITRLDADKAAFLCAEIEEFTHNATARTARKGHS